MTYTAKTKTWQLTVVSGGVNYYGLLEYTYSSGAWTLTPTDNVYTPITISVITDGYTHLLSEARRTLAEEILLTGGAIEGDLTDRIGYMNDTVNIDFKDAVPAVVWTIGELTEPEHYQAIKALIIKYLNDLTNVI